MTSLMTNTFAKYLRLGIIPRSVRGNWKDGDYMYSIYHDDVQYTIDDCGDYEIDYDLSYILDCLEHRDKIIEKNHEIVKGIYEYLKVQLQTDIWVRVNTGLQLNCTFGTSEGALAHLMMDFLDVKKAQEFIKNKFGFVPEFEEADAFVLMVLNQHGASIFSDYKNPKVELVCLDDRDEK